jgi:hypothetical protein
MTGCLFFNRLKNRIDLRHGLVQLAGTLHWEKVCAVVESYIREKPVAPKISGVCMFCAAVRDCKVNKPFVKPMTHNAMEI